MSRRTLLLAGCLALLGGCSLVRTTAEVSATAVNTATQAVGAGVKVAGATASGTAAVGSAAIAAGAATRSAAAATASATILGASVLMHWMQAAREEARRDELEHHPVTSLGQEQFLHADGRVFMAPGCLTAEGTPALLVQLRDGRLELRTLKATAASAGEAPMDTQRCIVTSQSFTAKPG